MGHILLAALKIDERTVCVMGSDEVFADDVFNGPPVRPQMDESASDLREWFLRRTSQCRALRRFRDGVLASDAREAGSILVICDRDEAEGLALADGVQAFMKGDAARKPQRFDAVLDPVPPLLQVRLRSKKVTVDYPHPLVLANPFALPIAQVVPFARGLARSAFSGVFLVRATDLAQAGKDVGPQGVLARALRRVPVRLYLPPLRDRPEEIPWHVERLLRQNVSVAPEAMAALVEHPWTGLGELNRVMSYANRRVRDHLSLAHLPSPLSGSAVSLFEALRRADERSLLADALFANQGAVGATACSLGCPERTLRRHMRELGIQKESYRPRMRGW